MSYEMTLEFGPSARYSWLAPTAYDAVQQHLVAGIGRAATLVKLAESLDEVVVAYEALSQDHVQAHMSVLDTLTNLAGQVARQVIQAEVAQVVRYGLQAGGAAALGALGLTSKQKAEVALVASGVAFIGGYLFGELKPVRQPILRANWNPYRGWFWTDLTFPPPAGLGWSQIEGGWR